MDILPIKPTSNNLIRPTTGTANDGGSKSQSGYINVRTGKPEKNDELTISDEGKRLIGEDPVIDEKSFLLSIKEFLLSLWNRFLKIFSFKIFKKKKKKPEKKEFLGYTGKVSEKT